MRQSYSKMHFCVCDMGLFPEIARTLAKQGVGKVTYYSRWEKGFPTLYEMKVAEGFDGVVRIQDPFAIIEDVDCWIFPDITFDGFQVHLESLSKRVFGARYAADIENFKISFRQHCEQVGIPVAPYEIAVGMTDLRKRLKRKKGKVFLKLEIIRGNMETQEIEDVELCEPYLMKIQHDLGPWAEKQNIIIEDEYPDSVEVALDLPTIDGKSSQNSVFGLEYPKAEYYCCHTMPYGDLPWPVRDVHERMAPILREYRARTNFPIEIRVRGPKEYVALDPCARMGHPVCSTVYLSMLQNLPDIFYFGAEGECVEPEFLVDNSWGMELCIFSDWAEHEPKAVYVPPKYRDRVKLRYAAEVDGIPFVLPQPMPNKTLGSVAATGKSWEECREEIIKVKNEIKGGGIDCYEDAFEKFKGEWGKLRDCGFDNLPEIN